MGIWSRIIGYVKKKLGITELEQKLAAEKAERERLEAELVKARQTMKRQKTTIDLYRTWRREDLSDEEKGQKAEEMIERYEEEEGIPYESE